MTPETWSCSGTDLAGVTAQTCTLTQGNSTTTPVYTQDSGDVSFELAFIIFLLSFVFMGMFFNLFFSKRLSRQNEL